MIGIYKITNPHGAIYIGQSINIKKRFASYKNAGAKNQPKLYNSFEKYGVENHHFDILEECDRSELNIRERYYQKKYNSINRSGLNCKLTNENDSNGTFSEETKLKMSESAKKKIWTDEHKRKLYDHKGEKNSMWGKKQSEETKKKISEANRNKGEATRAKQRLAAGNRPKEFYEHLAIVNKGNLPPNCIIVLNMQTGIFYDSVTDAARTIPVGKGGKTLHAKLSGRRRNNTDFLIV